MTRHIKFGDCELDLGGHALLRKSKPVGIEPVDYRVLVHLVSHAPDYVSSNSLLQQNWPDTVVGDNSLHQAIRRLRLALGDNARHPTYIQTLPRVGYRFIAAIENGAATANGHQHEISPVLVMRFHDYCSNDTSQFLSEGLLYEISRQLTSSDVAVISPDTIAHLRINGVDDVDLCSVVGARSKLTGVIAQQGQRLRVSVKLIQAETGRVIWSATFDSECESLFDAHTSIAARISETLTHAMANLGKAKPHHLSNKPTSLRLWRASLRHMQPQGSPT